MLSAFPSSLFRHSLSRQVLKQHYLPPSTLFISSLKNAGSEVSKRALLAPSSSDFASLAGKGAFVDKSSALQDFLQEDYPIHLLLRPRRSGKTTLLRMFRNFFECATPQKLAHRKSLFMQNNLAITRDGKFETEFGKYPVLYLDFSKIISDSMEDLVQKFKNRVGDMVRNLDIFKNRRKLSEDQRAFIEEIVNGTIHDSKWPGVLYWLTETLHEVHGREVIILIDEYDTPSSFAAQYEYFPKANLFFHEVFSDLLKNNEHVRGALIVGILCVAKAGWLSGLNNLSVFPLGQTSEYSTACMFTENETRTLYDRQAEIRELPFEFDDLNKWYNGYSTLDGTKLYNPWSVSKSLTRGTLTTWWTKSGYDATILARIAELLGSNFEFRAQCQALLNGDEITIKVDDIHCSSIQSMSAEQLWTLMFYAGYLTTSEIFQNARASVRIPNFEIQSEFRRWIRKDFDRRITPELSKSSLTLFNLMANGSFAEFSEAFRELFLTQIPQCILGSVETVYQDYLYAYLSSAAHAMAVKPKWTTKMEQPAGIGRLDIIFYRDVGVIVELKHEPQEEKKGYREDECKRLTKGTKQALEQCDTRHYGSIMPEQVTTVYEYGLAFLGPYCGVEARTVKKVNGVWVAVDGYTADEDEKRRERIYCRQ